MSKTKTLLCARCGNTQERAWFNRRICAPCRVKEEKGPKIRAQSAVHQAIKKGNLTRQPCEACGAEKTQAHHDDYAKPLDIRWLCRSCHQLHHYKFGPGKNEYSIG